MAEAVMAASQARVTTRTGHWTEVALGPLERLEDTCDRDTEFISYIKCQLEDIESTLKWAHEVFPDDPEHLVAKVAKAEQLWEASTCLFTCHLLGTLGNIHDLLLSPCGGGSGPGGPGSHVVAEWCPLLPSLPRWPRRRPHGTGPGGPGGPGRGLGDTGQRPCGSGRGRGRTEPGPGGPEGAGGSPEAAVAPAVALGTLGDEDEQRLRRLRTMAEAAAAALGREEGRHGSGSAGCGLGTGVTMGLMVLCAAVLSLDSARSALGVAEDSHLLLALTVVAVSCEVAWRGLETSRRHLATAAGHQQDMALRLRDRARRVAATRASAEATAATNEATADVLGRLEEATLNLGKLVAAVTRDREVTPWGTRRQGFPSAARELGDIVVALGTSGEEQEVVRRLEVAQGALAGQG
ncbi:uncharacterized protein LOC135286323 [Passer domesticus]|uniref:uncharacterized protein LOC135286323 n=1 Tax=Passer domesticus TaxID=48849 RepID=UPI0030FF085D